MAQVSRLKAALYLASRGWKVFPLHWPRDGRCSCGKGQGHPIGKHPMSRGWQEEASDDQAKISQWWKKTPEANIGIATGAVSGIIVLDIDGSEGEKTVAVSGSDPSVTVLTGKGRQIYFKYPGERVRNKVGRFPQLDSRGDGGYVVGPGSLHHSGKTYRFAEGLRPDDTPLADAPKWWLDVVLDSSLGRVDPSLGETGTREDRAESPREAPKQVKTGSRNSTLASMAGVLRDKGLSVETIAVALRDYNRTHCSPPLGDEEVAGIAQSYGRYEAGEPNRKVSVSKLCDIIRDKRAFLTSPIDSGGQGVRLMLYSGGVYRPDGADVARRMADRILGNASRPDTINSVVELIKERTKVHEELLNPRALELVNTEAGMLEWRTGKVRDHSPELMSTFQVKAAYDPKARCPIIEKFMREVFPEDALPLVEEIVGYLCVPSTRHQKAVMLVGEGANGKSTFLQAVCALIQEHNISRMSLQQLEDSPFAAAELQGKLANVYADIPNSRLEKSDTFKSIVSGDPIKAERKFGHPFTLRTSARLVFSANAFPKSSDSSQAYFRRWIIIPFPNKFEGKAADPSLSQKLCSPSSLNALFAMGIRGLRRLEENDGFSLSKSTEVQAEAYKTENDSAYEFMRECLKPGDERERIPKIDVWNRYVSWCADSGVRFPANNRRLNHCLETNMNLKEVRDGAKRTKCWDRLAFAESAVPAEAKY